MSRRASKIPAVDEQYLGDLRERVALSVARRAVKTAEVIDGVRVGVDFVLSRGDCEALLDQVASKVRQLLQPHDFLFAIARGPPHKDADTWPLVIAASTPALLQKAAALVSAKFLGRVKLSETGAERWLGHITEIGASERDKALLWDVVRKTSHVLNPKSPPPGARSAAQLVALARMRIDRLSPAEAFHELQDPAFPLPVVIVDIRSAAQRVAHGVIPDALHAERVGLEFSFDPRSEEKLSVVDRYDLRVIVFDQNGTSSSLAAATLHDLGLLNATDINGGYAAWKAVDLPTTNIYS